MIDNWKPYLCNVNDKLASIFVNLGLREDVPIASKPWLLWTWVYFQSPRADGLSDSKEAPTLYEIEDSLNLSVSRACRAIPCGRITTAGRREFYFYGETKDGFHKAVREAFTGFERYKFDLGEQEDHLWEQYLNVLYPSPEGLQRIANMDSLDVLAEKGDVLTVPREVQHWMNFGSEESRAHSALPLPLRPTGLCRSQAPRGNCRSASRSLALNLSIKIPLIVLSLNYSTSPVVLMANMTVGKRQ
jgi:hypothetical protein